MAPTRIIVGPLPTSTSDAILREMFTDFGTVVEGKMYKIPNNSEPFAFGWVRFQQESAANLAIQAWKDGGFGRSHGPFFIVDKLADV
ncbi:hypothetical protein N7G274_003752 [Stereocaulon virgatum]|uniref:RRM domain-containing protein n=1 Tax=Stereocaulon virgatum TaxID=373712 RepID=A0ABR4ACF9_9LECA